MLRRRTWSLVPLLLALAAPVTSQSTDDPAAEMRRWLQGQRDDFHRYVAEQDRAFAEFLGQAWQEFEVLAGRRRDPVPKPDTPPRVPAPQPPPGPAPAPQDTVRPVPGPAPQRPPEQRPEPPPGPPRTPLPPATPPTSTGTVAVELAGVVWPLPVDRDLGRLAWRRPGPEDASTAWLELSAVDTAPLLAACDQAVAEQQLGDWGRFLLLERVAASVYPGDRSRQALLHWYLAVRAGQDVRLAYARPGYVVLYAASAVIFQAEFLARDGRAYYLHDPAARFAGQTRLRSYDGHPPGARAALDLVFSRLPRTDPRPLVRTLCWELAGETWAVDVVLDRRLVDFLATVPQTGLASHFGAGLSDAALASLRDGLAPLLAGREAAGQVAVLLHLVQHALPYATDEEQFGREDYLYPDETLLHPAADCEDRAALLVALVRELVGLEAVGLDYPGHVAAAVALGPDAPGDRFVHGSVIYSVCDPTYIGAGPGRSMPIAGADRPGVIVPAR